MPPDRPKTAPQPPPAVTSARNQSVRCSASCSTRPPWSGKCSAPTVSLRRVRLDELGELLTGGVEHRVARGALGEVEDVRLLDLVREPGDRRQHACRELSALAAALFSEAQILAFFEPVAQRLAKQRRARGRVRVVEAVPC